MRPSVRRNPRLVELYGLYKKVGEEILGSTGRQRKDLIRLRRRVRDEILAIQNETENQDDTN